LINFEEIVPKKNYKFFINDDEIVDLELATPSSISNRFDLIAGFVRDMSKTLGEEFDSWFSNFFRELYKNTCSYCRRFDDESKCVKAIESQERKNKKLREEDVADIISVCHMLPYNEKVRAKLIYDNVEEIEKWVDKYLDILNYDFSIYVNEDKIRKTSIVFGKEEIEKIMRLSSYFKIYSIIFNSENLKLDIRIHKKIFNKFLEKIDKSIIEKIFEIIRTKTFKYKQTDNFMWEYIKMVQGKEIETYIIEIFNFLMNNILVLCRMDKNPITYFVTVVDSAIIWILRSVYKASIIYSDEISSTDIQTIKINNLSSYSYNDTLGRIKIISYDWVYKKLEEESRKKPKTNPNQLITEFHSVISRVTDESPLISSLVYPLLSKLTNIPYRYFKTLNNEQAIVLSAYVKHLLTRTFKDKFQNLFRLLECYPEGSVPITTSFQLEYLEMYINLYNKIKEYMGFDTCTYQYDMYRYIIGRLARIKFMNIYSYERQPVDIKSVEWDAIHYYTYYFAGFYDENQFAFMKNELTKSF